MTESEFKTWFANHRACFPAIDSWLGKIDAVAAKRSENPLTSRDVLRSWLKALDDIAFADAKEASTKMLKGEAEAKSFDDHPKIIRKLAYAARGEKRQAPRTAHWIDGERTLCAKCGDSGGLTVVHAKTLAAIRAGKEPAIERYTMVVRCTCIAGSQKIPAQRQIVDDDVQCDWNLYDPAEWERVLNEVAAPVSWTPAASYESITGGGNGGY